MQLPRCRLLRGGVPGGSLARGAGGAEARPRRTQRRVRMAGHDPLYEEGVAMDAAMAYEGDPACDVQREQAQDAAPRAEGGPPIGPAGRVGMMRAAVRIINSSLVARS